MKYCFKSGLIWQGLLHDNSKYGFEEFWCGAKYYLGTKSPHHQERTDKGYSEAWMHHKGRNKHHVEYWIDFSSKTMRYEPMDMPNRYLGESICDRIAASENYNRGNFKREMVREYYEKEKGGLPISENTRIRMEFLINYYVENGNLVFKYIKKHMRNKQTTIPM